ncbi:MAG: prolyl oligopeptidase family serine peptidase [Candidatus Sericytochromatia bacterium]
MNPIPLIPREVLFGNPERLSPKLSPDGQKLAYIAPADGVLNVWVRSVGQADDRVVTQDQERGIRTYFWSSDSQHLLYLQDQGGNENWRLYGVTLATGAVRDYTPFEGVQAQVLQRDKRFPHELLIALNRNNPQLHDVYRLDLRNGTLQEIARNPGHFMGWVADAQFEVRAAVAAHSDGSMSLQTRDGEGTWQERCLWGFEDSLNSSPSHFSADGQSLFLLDSLGANTTQLVRLDLVTGEREVMARDPRYDVSGLCIDVNSYAVQAVSFARAREDWLVLDAAVADDFAFLKAYRNGDFNLINRDDADTTWLVAYEFDDAPVAYYAYTRAEQQMHFLFEHQPALKGYPLAPMEPIRFTARDGLELEGYLTYPPGVPREKLPLVLNVHGGPWWRDTWGYHPEAQWLANRGYACLQLNYRGSTGYGKAFLNAGDREWGGKMHDDLIDAVNWAVAECGVDPERVGIYGGSYGGYAALVGATFTPDVFRCAVDMVGPSSLLTLIASFPAYWATMLDNFKRRVGDPETEAEFLKSRSPLFKLDQLHIPLLIAQGANDPRVTQLEAEQIVAALRDKGLPHEYLLFEDEGHGLAKPSNRMRFYAAVERFLAEHLGGRYEMAA